MELQIALLLLAGAGMQGFTEWQCANMSQRTNKLVTDIFVALIKYICGLPQGNGFSVEIANLYAMLLLLWWNMDPLNTLGAIAPFTSPRHAFPLMAGGALAKVAGKTAGAVRSGARKGGDIVQKTQNVSTALKSGLEASMPLTQQLGANFA